MSLLLRLLLAGIFCLRAEGEGEGEGADAGDKGDGGDAGDKGESADDNIDLDAGDGGEGDGEQGDQGEGEGGEKKQAPRKRQDDPETLRLRQENEELRRQQQDRRAPPDEETRVRQREDAVLNDPKATELQKWQVQSNRTLRENNSNSRRALAQAQDLADKTSFDRLEVSKPNLYKKYADRVEEARNKMIGQGQQPPPREAVMRFLIGDDAINGKLAPKKKAEPVDRGKSPGARSDVKGNGKLTNKQKLEKRLENQQI